MSSEPKFLLCKEHHHFFKTNITVTSAQRQLEKRDYRIYTGLIDPQQSPICRLNEDCLWHLYRFLDLSAQYRLSRLCERFAKVFETVFQKMYKKFFDWIVLEEDYGFSITPEEWYILLEDCGHLVESFLVTIESDRLELMKNVPLYCPNLKSLVIENGCEYAKDFGNNIGYFKRINSVNLYNVGINDDFVRSLTCMDSLEVLRLASCTQITGKHFESFKNLKNFDISLCNNVEATCLQNMFESTPALTLTALDISWCLTASEDTITSIIQHCHNLSEISLNIEQNIDCIARLPNMEKLVINFTKCSYSGSLFQELVTHAKHRLRVFSIVSKMCDKCILSENQKECISNLYALEELTLCNIRINNDFLGKLSSLLNLKYFKTAVDYGVEREDIVNFIRSVPKLETYVHNDFDPKLTSLIIDMLKKRKPTPNKKFTLSFDFCTDEDFQKLMQEFIIPNKDVIRYHDDYM